MDGLVSYTDRGETLNWQEGLEEDMANGPCDVERSGKPCLRQGYSANLETGSGSMAVWWWWTR